MELLLKDLQAAQRGVGESFYLCQTWKAYSLREQGKKNNCGEINDLSVYGPPRICVLFCIQIPVWRQAMMESWGNKFSAIPEHSGDR